jgi:hypothetical protein
MEYKIKIIEENGHEFISPINNADDATQAYFKYGKMTEDYMKEVNVDSVTSYLMNEEDQVLSVKKFKNSIL